MEDYAGWNVEVRDFPAGKHVYFFSVMTLEKFLSVIEKEFPEKGKEELVVSPRNKSIVVW